MDYTIQNASGPWRLSLLGRSYRPPTCPQLSLRTVRSSASMILAKSSTAWGATKSWLTSTSKARHVPAAHGSPGRGTLLMARSSDCSRLCMQAFTLSKCMGVDSIFHPFSDVPVRVRGPNSSSSDVHHPVLSRRRLASMRSWPITKMVGSTYMTFRVPTGPSSTEAGMTTVSAFFAKTSAAFLEEGNSAPEPPAVSAHCCSTVTLSMPAGFRQGLKPRLHREAPCASGKTVRPCTR